jgi:hypothetical protein
LETTTVADLSSGKLPHRIQVLAAEYEEAEKVRPRR